MEIEFLTLMMLSVYSDGKKCKKSVEKNFKIILCYVFVQSYISAGQLYFSPELKITRSPSSNIIFNWMFL